MVNPAGNSNTGVMSSSGSTTSTQKKSDTIRTGSDSSDLLNIYSRSLFTLPPGTAMANKNGHFAGPGAVLSGKECVNLNSSKEHHIDELQDCCHINEVKVHSDGASAQGDRNTLLVFDLTTSGSLISSSDAPLRTKASDGENGSSSSRDVYRIHLSLPSTLLKRPKYHFEKLLQSVIDDSKRSKLMSLIDDCNTFLFYDGSSNMNRCLISTYWLIRKFSDFLHDKLGKKSIRMFMLESIDKGVENGTTADLKGSESHGPAKGPKLDAENDPMGGDRQQKKLNLTIKILPKSSDKMFIQSIKKDTVHYSPNSLKRFFKFHIPDALEDDDPILPNWLKPFSRRDESDKILQKLLHNFEFLESLELNRLERGLTTNNKNRESSKLQDSNSYHKIYSLSNLQKDFQRQGKLSKPQSRPVSPCPNDINLKLSIPKSQPLSIVNPTSKTNPTEAATSTPLSSSSSSSYQEADGDPLLTPMDNYEMSQGIRSFAKNRYSNILPYEHSRVKLQPSPLHGPTSGATFSPSAAGPTTNQSVKTPSEIGLSKKRRNSNPSYFNQKFVDESSQRDEESRKTPGAATSGEGFNDYFNANYLNLPQVNSDFNYIATQAPLPSTIDDFWKVISTNKVKVIISLNSNDELFLRKWDIYWNNDRSGQKYKIDITETFENCCNVEGCILRLFSFYRNGDEKNESKKLVVYQLQYTKWLDSCGIVMEDILSLHTIKNMLLNKPSVILSDLRSGRNKDAMSYANDIWPANFKKSNTSVTQPPLLVHCSAGCGRTGVFITLDFLLNVLNEPTSISNSIDVWNMSQDLIFITINELRKQRISMVQNLTQYITCYESILQFFATKKQNQRTTREVSGTSQECILGRIQLNN